MLRLLAQREQGYEDIAALMGLSVDEVRVRVKDALAELEREGEERPVLPAAEPEPPAPDPEPEPPAPAPAAQPAPAPAKPEPPTPVAAATKEWRTPPVEQGNRPPRLGIPKQPGARAAIVAGAVALIGIVIVLIIGGGDGDGGSTGTAASGGTGEPTAVNGEQTEPTEAVLKPVGGGDASGTATFGNFEESLALLVEADGLEPPGKGEIYAVWLAGSPTEMIPVSETKLENGNEINGQIPLEVGLLAFIADETITQVTITRADQDRLESSLTKASKNGKSPSYTGTAVLRGTITGPIVGAELPESSE
jgi:hypothetical protein